MLPALLQLANPHHFFPAVLVDSSSDLGLLIEQVSYEDQTLGIEVDVLLWTRWLLHPSSHLLILKLITLQKAQPKHQKPPCEAGGEGGVVGGGGGGWRKGASVGGTQSAD